jgi:AAA domain/Protein kinase domain
MTSKEQPDVPDMLAGRYVLTDNVRKGAQATVTKAFDTKTSKLVAVKRMKFGPDDQRAREAFQREASMLQSLAHDNILQLIEVDRDQDHNWFLVLEWIPDNLEDVIAREGAMSWLVFWARFGRPILDAMVYAQKKRIAHRDIKPKNLLVTESGTVKLADYGIAKLLDAGGAWKPVSGVTFRFDHTPGYTPSKPEEEQFAFSRDCFAFAAVAVSCVAGRVIEGESDLRVAAQEAALPEYVRPILERCLSNEPQDRPPLASVLKEQIEQAEAQAELGSVRPLTVYLFLSGQVQGNLEKRLDLHGHSDLERFVLGELSEVCGITARQSADRGGFAHVELIGATWKFEGLVAGRCSEALHVTRASEIGAALASELREAGLVRPLSFSFVRPKDPDRAGQELKLLLAETLSSQSIYVAEREARATQRIFRVWRGYLRDRADLESKRGNAIRYVDRQVSGDRVVFTTEIAQKEEIVGQDRVVRFAGSQIGGKIHAVSFNQMAMDVTFGDPNRLLRRGEIAINTIAAQKALTHQSQALDAVVFDRAVSLRLKTIILDPRNSTPATLVADVTPIDKDFDEEKTEILAKALGVQDVLAIVAPPGTGKTKLITEIVVQWLRLNPEHRILLSSQTHTALDNVLNGVAALDPSVEMIRIGRTDDPKISDQSKKLLLERRVESWISEVRKFAEAEMTRWADTHGVDRAMVAVGMKVERLLQLLKWKVDIRDRIARTKIERIDVKAEGQSDSSAGVDDEEVDEETSELDSEIGTLQRELQTQKVEERNLRQEMSEMGEYAAALSHSDDLSDLADWAAHFSHSGPLVEACRERLSLLEDWQLRVGRSSDFNAALLSSAGVIAGTCVGVAGVKGMEEVAYDLCIVDEASKATPTEILIPMSRSRRWIIVGDPKQLPPFFEELGKDLLLQFDDEEVKATMLDRFVDEHDGLPASCRAELRRQYRMIQPIGDLISECFYDKRLISPVKSHGLKLGAAFPKPITWYSTHTLPERSEQPEGQTFQNAVEVKCIRGLLQRLEFVAKAQKRRISVAVIAGYTAQVKLLRDMESQGVAEWANLEVACNSVDAFQGRQADVCIYSVVRSNSNKHLGFLREPPRLNVALSRGKSALVIVGDQMFCRTAREPNPFRKVIDFIDSHSESCSMEPIE